MSEVSTSEEAINFIEEPLNFFGQENVTFGMPASYYQDIEDGASTFHASHTVYEKRMRGRYFDGDFLEINIEALSILENLQEQQYRDAGYEGRRVGPLPTESATFDVVEHSDKICRFLNDSIVENHWAAAENYARVWFDSLPDGSETKTLASQYVGFAGNMILTQYCKTAIALSSDSLSEDDFVSMKHFMTVCWPTADALEPFIPDEVADKRQLLREVFLQLSYRSVESVRHYARMLRYFDEDTSQDDVSREEREDAYLTAVMDMRSATPQRLESIHKKLWIAVDQLRAQHKYYETIDLLNLGLRSLQLNKEDVQLMIDEVAIEGAKYFTSDLGKYDEEFMQKAGNHYYRSSNRFQMQILYGAPAISEDTYTKMRKIEQSRNLEHELQEFDNADLPQKEILIQQLISTLAETPEDALARVVTPEIETSIFDFFNRPERVLDMPSDIDANIKTVIILRNKGVLSSDQQAIIFSSFIDNFHDRILSDSEYRDKLGRLIGFLSPILRGTSKTDDPADERVWDIITPGKLSEIFDALILHSDERKWMTELKLAFMSDIRAAWNEYWDRVEDY